MNRINLAWSELFCLRSLKITNSLIRMLFSPYLRAAQCLWRTIKLWSVPGLELDHNSHLDVYNYFDRKHPGPSPTGAGRATIYSSCYLSIAADVERQCWLRGGGNTCDRQNGIWISTILCAPQHQKGKPQLGGVHCMSYLNTSS